MALVHHDIVSFAISLATKLHPFRDFLKETVSWLWSEDINKGLAVSCAQGNVRAVDPELPHDVQNLHTGLYILCLLSCLYSLWLTWPPAPVPVAEWENAKVISI